MTTAGFPHSEICGSMAICAYPQLIAACHVLHRLLMPRHSPCALVRLTFFGSPFSGKLYESLIDICLPFITEKLNISFLFALFGFQDTNEKSYLLYGGLRWARTTDLTLIRRAL